MSENYGKIRSWHLGIIFWGIALTAPIFYIASRHHIPWIVPVWCGSYYVAMIMAAVVVFFGKLNHRNKVRFVALIIFAGVLVGGSIASAYIALHTNRGAGTAEVIVHSVCIPALLVSIIYALIYRGREEENEDDGKDEK